MNIHVLGTGAIGCHMASILRTHRHNVTLLLRSQNHLTEFTQKKNSIIYHNKNTVVVDGFKSSLFHQSGMIQSLIVATKAQHTVHAIQQVSDRLSSDSTILLLQNGMGVVEELMETVWNKTDPPHIMVGINRHAVERTSPYEIYHHSGDNDPNALVLGEYPVHKEQHQDELVSVLTGIPELNASFIPWKEARKRMAQKLIINACINPICALLESKNEILKKDQNPHTKYLVKSIFNEAYEVLKDELPGNSSQSLEKMVWDMVDIAASNSCSTLQDIRNNRLTEIDYINGYICRLGREKKIDVKANELFVHLIHAKELMYTQ
ncbi:2-dehydropantoate 2-reductase [Pilobolus umbonatus]|nr:2-dehydropantoate 2-reductase [Pilobolus umbonatus]